MTYSFFPVIDPVATGENIVRLRKIRGLSVRDLQDYFGFEEPQAIYKWQRGKSLPSVDNLYALGAILEVSMDEIIVPMQKTIKFEQQTEVCCSLHLYPSYQKNFYFIISCHPFWGSHFCITKFLLIETCYSFFEFVHLESCY